MNFLDIASIVFICTAANHIGPIPDIEIFINRKLPVVGCVKCLTFWCVLGFGCYNIATYRTEMMTVLAISFLSAWASIWLDLAMGMIDKLYLKIYDTLYPATDEADADKNGAADPVPDVPGEEGCDDDAAKETGSGEGGCDDDAAKETGNN